MKNPIQELVEVSQHFGNDKSFVLAGGGNTSYKTEDLIWIKASGISLATVMEDSFVCLSRDRLKLISTKVYNEDVLIRENEVKMDLHTAILHQCITLLNKGKRVLSISFWREGIVYLLYGSRICPVQESQ